MAEVLESTPSGVSDADNMSTTAPTTTVTSTLPRTPRQPPAAPPTGPLPALPVAKSRTKSTDEGIPTSHGRRSSTASTSSQIPSFTPKKGPPSVRSVTISGLPTPRTVKANSTPQVPTLSTMNIPAPSPSPPISLPPKSVRKMSSIGSFPLPPQVNARVSSLPPSPLSSTTSPNDTTSPPLPATSALNKARRDSSKHRSADTALKKPKTRSSGYGLRPRYSAGGASGLSSSSLLNRSSDQISVASTGGIRASDSLLSLPSPPYSRASSANGSYNTDHTVIEDVNGDSERGRSRESDSVMDQDRTSKDTKGNVTVSVRVRPDAPGEASQADGEWLVDGRRSLISFKGREGGDYRYDNVFSPHDQNARVYDNAAKRLVRRVMEGYHGTVFAYGMTGTGKTFSMQGTSTSPGVIPLAINDIFSYIRENPNREFLLRVSYLEIYNEKIHDLLIQATPGQAAAPQEEIKLREDSKRGVYATPLKEEIVQSPNQLLRVIARGDNNRKVSSTQFNARSSRSHAVVQIVVESRERTANHGAYFDKETRRADKIMPGGVLVSTLSLIDLAGSEKAADNKERRAEGAHINKSLLTLGTVIARLSGDDEKDKDGKEGAKAGAEKERSLKHLPFRDSKLTRLLQPALSGDSLVSILCTVQLSSVGTAAAQASSHTGETLNTLKFASRAKNNIVSHAKRNESNANGGDAGSRALLDRYRLEIQDLRQKLETQNKAKDEAEKNDEAAQDRRQEEEMERAEQVRHEEQMLEMQLARTALKERISHLNRLILSSKSLGVNSGRFSSASFGYNPRMSTYSVTTGGEYGRAVSVRSRDSVRSLQQRDSAMTLDVPTSIESARGVSSGSVLMGSLPVAQVSQLEEQAEEDEDGNILGGADDDGHASLVQQNKMLQADLMDKNRYIQTLEKRLLQARRTSHSRVSMNFKRADTTEEGGSDAIIREKDREIEELRAKLDDQTRMVTALRSAARKRDMLEGSKRKSNGAASVAGDEAIRPATSSGVVDVADTVPDISSLPFKRQTSSRASNHSMTNGAGPTINTRRLTGHRSNPSTASRASSNGLGINVVNFSKTPLSPIGILSSPTRASPVDFFHDAHTHPDGTPQSDSPAVGLGLTPASFPSPPIGASFHNTTNNLNSSNPTSASVRTSTASARRKSVDEMTQLLDQMIQDKVESGHVIRGDRGSLRVRHDTVLLAHNAAIAQAANETLQAEAGAEKKDGAVAGTI